MSHTVLPEPKPGIPRGIALLRDPLLNKGTAFTQVERLALGLEGLLPPQVFPIEVQEARFLEGFRAKQTPIEKYLSLSALQDRNETLFFRVVVDNVEEMLPILYTPTVGQACQQFPHIFRRSRGMYISYEQRGNVRNVVRNWPREDVRAIVMTDGERILGLGDQGAGGMGIPIGKLGLYTACAGLNPAQVLPVMLDVGTENEARLADPLYFGLRHRRVRGLDFHEFVGEFIAAAREQWPKVLIQFEDFANTTAFELLETWRDRITTFNDDIQGTASVVLAGLYSSLRITKKKLNDQRLLFLGAGEAGVGIGDLCVSAMVEEGATLDEARSRLWFCDSKGLVVKSRKDLAHHKLRYAHDAKPEADFLAAVKAVKPTAIIGTSTIAKTFSKAVIEEMCKLNERPIVFALSNPTDKSECTAEEAYGFSHGRAIYASGSPFPDVTVGGKTFVPGQCNNSYIFPGVGLGIVAVAATRVTDSMFAAAARALANRTSEADLDKGRIYPSLSEIRDVSAHIAAAIAEVAFRENLATVPKPADVLAYVKSQMWIPRYESYVR
jgi:malate dehydrogenase (oxaloacetate-decarboxylating)(NADP+)